MAYTYQLLLGTLSLLRHDLGRHVLLGDNYVNQKIDNYLQY